MASLVCKCGRRLNVAGAIPGRVGKCPTCGAVFRVVGGAASPAPTLPPPKVEPPVEDRDESEVGGYAVLPPSVVIPPTFTATRATLKQPDLAVNLAAADRRGLCRPPETVETHFIDSLLYPLWDAGCVGLLAFMPIALSLTSLLSFGLVPTYVLGGQPTFVTMGALLFIFPMLVIFALVMGRVLSYLEQVLVSSAQGDLHHPRLPSWDLFSLVGVWVRWLWAGAVGFSVPGFLAILYWIHCGDLDWADWTIVGTCLAAGAVYALMALVAVVLHGDFAAANPVTVLGALRRAGWGFFGVGSMVVAAVAWSCVGVAVLFRLPGVVLPVVATWIFWLAFVYQAIVVLRVIGLFARRHASALGWFPDRPRWGA